MVSPEVIIWEQNLFALQFQYTVTLANCNKVISSSQLQGFSSPLVPSQHIFAGAIRSFRLARPSLASPIRPLVWGVSWAPQQGPGRFRAI